MKDEKGEREGGLEGWRYEVETEREGPLLGKKEMAKEERLERGSERRRVAEKGRMEADWMPIPRPWRPEGKKKKNQE